MSHHLLDHLNPAQQESVGAPPCHMMVLAGAGSGKTRVLVHRIAWLFDQYGVSPNRVLAVTFTNKAAKEMRGRIESQFNMPTQGLWVGTFHGIAHRLLRTHFALTSLPETFQVLDSEDQYRLVRRVLRNLNLDEKHWPPKQAQHFINKQKDNGLRAAQLQAGDDFFQATMIKVYAAYQALCDQGGLVDFAELLLRCYELLKQQPELLAQYQARFEHILVDEFQDTNMIQYRWIKLLAGDSNFVMAVGDDDQSIYSWRGARVENIQRFEQDFPNVKVIRLEQNYRSTKTILDAANAVISHNRDRMGKSLWTEGSAGDPIALYAGFNELDEARFIVSRIQEATMADFRRSDIAILYRSNALSRVIEEALLQANMPYRVYGGLRFFERAEIKNALAYCRLITNADNDAAFERVINTPTRGIGERTIAHLRELGREQGISLWQALLTTLDHKTLPGRANNALQAFVDLIEMMKRDVAGCPLGEQVEHIVAHSGLREFYKKEPGEKGQTRIDNLDELITAAGQYTPENVDDDNWMVPFLSHAALEAGEGQAEAFTDCVQLMTMHSAKGLEFPIVFVCGMEEELFPPRQALDDGVRLEEERRLCYVAMTRAMQRLILTYAEYRRLYGENRQHFPSRFIREIPSECIQEVRMKSSISRPVSIKPSTSRRFTSSAQGVTVGDTQFFVGQHVSHPKFGDGVILNFEGQGEQARLQINFSAVGTKWLVAGYAKLAAAG